MNEKQKNIENKNQFVSNKGIQNSINLPTDAAQKQKESTPSGMKKWDNKKSDN